MTCIIALSKANVGAGAELDKIAGVIAQRMPARIHHDQPRAGLGGLLEIGRGDGVVFRRIGADHE